ncbi:MAG TPA: CDP-alcohol phosphatidyltransferase family protein [Armatimonadota bacterium]|nr:CDP-alcohol phosphatidyltransferase family protein [Armatimonadota bacterium]
MKLKHIPNALCWARLAAIPVLWVLAVSKNVTPFVILLIVAMLTDTLDGYLCRKYDLATEFGAKLDRIADDTLTLNALAWMIFIRPEFFRDYWPQIVVMLSMLGISVGYQYLRFKRKVPFHTIIGKSTAWVIGFFMCYTFLWGPKPWAVAILLGFVMAALLEEIILVATREDHELDEHVLSLFLMPPRGAAPAPDDPVE